MRLHPRARVLCLLLPLLVAGGCDPASQDDGGRPGTEDPLTLPFHPHVDLRADVNRNGTVDLDDPTEDEGEDTWSAGRGAVFLANLDDDQDACEFSLSATTPDDVLAQCHDAIDAEVNGEEDLADLARLRTVPWPDAPDHAMGLVSVEGPASRKVRLFRKTPMGFLSQRLPGLVPLRADELRRGVELAIEGRDIVRDPAEWDGYVDVTLTITAGDLRDQRFKDTVRMRVAPVVLFHHLLPARNVYVSRLPEDQDQALFRRGLGGALSEASRPMVLSEFATDDLWTQDYFEPAYMAMPAPGGGQHFMQVNLRAANVFEPGSKSLPLRAAGRIVYWLRGPDQAAVQQYQHGMTYESQTLNSFGNTEVIPPYALGGVRYPMGRLLRGRGPDSRPDYQPDPSFTRMLEAQAVQPPVYVDTSWLAVSHVDETVSFLPAATPRGWIALVADPALARRMLLDLQARGHGDAKLFAGLSWGLDRPAEMTVSQVLDTPGVMNASALAALEIDSQLAILKEETGLTDAEVIRVPFLFQELPDGVGAYQPATVNLLVVANDQVIAPEPHGPLVDGKDPFKTHLEEALAPYGIRVDWADGWSPYHIGGGEVHCATNSARELPQAKWWEGGR